ncbi:MAG: hypothetical protein ABL974_16445, partial [Prosthecobacter sp.]
RGLRDPGADFGITIGRDPRRGARQHHGGGGLSALEPVIIVQRIVEKLSEIIGTADLTFYSGRIIFAVCVREMECWLLPLWDKQKADKCEGCIDTLNRALSRQDERPINPDRKDVRHYEHLSKGYRKRKILLEEGRLNPSLAIFLNDLEQRDIVLSPEV